MRTSWTLDLLQNLYSSPFIQLISQAHGIHTQFHDPLEIQVCNLISIKTGGCPEDCAYCAQSSRYQTSINATPLMHYEDVMNRVKKAQEQGATRICLGAAWKEVRDNKHFEDILHMVRSITAMGLEVCCTLGMLKEHQAKKLKEAGLYAYNHNLDSSENFYKTIITTRTYQDRLNTLNIVQQSGLSICCGGILGMGETLADRLELLLTLSHIQPESVPINKLSSIPGTPLENRAQVSIWECVRMIATTRIVLPKSIIRLSCGRIEMTHIEQALCFLSGANSIFAGEKLLTVANTSIDSDNEMFELLGLKKRPAFIK